MFDIGWSEMLVLAVLGLLVLGPRELPLMLRRLGRALGQLRQMARKFSRALDAVAEESEQVAEVDLDTLTNKRDRP